MKKEFEKEFEGRSYDLDDVWGWVETQLHYKLIKAYQRGFENGIKWQKLENKDEDK